jgi:hypothetical protein
MHTVSDNVQIRSEFRPFVGVPPPTIWRGSPMNAPQAPTQPATESAELAVGRCAALFRNLWIATIVSNVGTWMVDAGAAG